MEFNLNNLATVDTTDILQEAVQLSLVDSDVNEVSDDKRKTCFDEKLCQIAKSAK